MSQKIAKTSVAGAPVQRLKAERVELMLARLSRWKPEANQGALWGSYDLGSPQQAAAFVTCLAGVLAEGRGLLTVRGGVVSIRLQAEKEAGLTPALGSLARRIDRLAEEMQKIREGR